MDHDTPQTDQAKPYDGVERRKHQRFDVFLTGHVRTTEALAPCRVFNISVGGALIEADMRLRIGERIMLELPGCSGVTGSVVRIDQAKAGICFETAKAALEAEAVDWYRADDDDAEPVYQ